MVWIAFTILLTLWVAGFLPGNAGMLATISLGVAAGAVIFQLLRMRDPDASPAVSRHHRRLR